MPVTTVDRSRHSRPLPSTVVTILVARRHQPLFAIADDCRHRDGGGGLGDEGKKMALAEKICPRGGSDSPAI